MDGRGVFAFVPASFISGEQPRVCMTDDDDQRAIVRALPAIRRPVDTNIRSGMVLERHREKERWRLQNKMDYDKINKNRIHF